MKEILELRINYKFASLLFEANEGRNIGTSVKVIELTRDDPRFLLIPETSKLVADKYGEGFYFSWQLSRKYSKNEMETALLFHLIIKSTFEPAGEECGTIYNEKESCEICGVNRKQIGSLKLRAGSIPKRDISKTISGEIVVSSKFVKLAKQYRMKGLLFEPIFFDEERSDYYQLVVSSKIELSNNTLVGIDPFDFSESSNGVGFEISGRYNIFFKNEIYKCPRGHTLGLNLLSEPYVLDNPIIYTHDLLSSRQEMGVKRGLLRPEPLYFCSPAFRKMIEKEKLRGLEFELSNID